MIHKILCKLGIHNRFQRIILYIPENSDDLFTDINFYEDWFKSEINPFTKAGAILGLGKNIFLFDIESCEILES